MHCMHTLPSYFTQVIGITTLQNTALKKLCFATTAYKTHKSLSGYEKEQADPPPPRCAMPLGCLLPSRMMMAPDMSAKKHVTMADTSGIRRAGAITRSSRGSIPLGLAQHDSLEWSRRESIDHSRHRTEYEALRLLGRGAFGTAYQVRNRVDSQIYCLKGIRIQNGADKEHVLREVQVLSSLHSDNVVRYYSAWVEKGEQPLGDESDSDDSDEWTRSATVPPANDQPPPTCHLCQNIYTEWEVSFEQWGLIDAVLQPLDLCIPCYKKSIPDGTEDIQIRQTQILQDYLFILMEYCELTLRDAVTNADSKTKWDYFCQCVQGVAHLHSKGVIHRDIKPNNVFVHKGSVKIGDLGLATIIGSNPDGTTRMGSTVGSSNKSSQVGTYLYTAPEVASGFYDEKCDVYSLGILLVEMFSTFKTGMERAKVLGSGLVHLPEDWTAAHPVQSQLARQMVNVSSEDRPTCSQVLADLIGRGLYEKRNVEALVTSLSDEVARLQADLELNRQELLRLRKILGEHGISY